MKTADFLKEIDANSTTFTRFMNQHGPEKGAQSTIYEPAWAFFKKRELRGEKLPKNVES
jgi:hypothetical protein